MKTLGRRFLFLSLLLLSAPSLFSVPAFPGAEGWGAASVGGRGGRVIHVTNLRVSGVGSLPYAVAVPGPKIIVFDTAGVINLASNSLRITSNTTLAGQTAPGGITLVNGGIYTANGASNIIVRHIRVRRSADAPDGDCFRFDYATDCIFDHCSGLWCSDEILDFVHSARITVQYTSISEPASCYEQYGTGSGYGNTRTGILGNTVTGGITLYRCLMSDHSKRTPYLSNSGGANTGHTYEFINNFVYNCGQASGESFDNNTIPLNLVGNYYKPGRNTAYFSPYFAHRGSSTKIMRVHASGNYHSSQPTRTWPSCFFDSTTVSSFSDTFIAPRKTQVSAVLTAQQAMAEVTAKVGPFPRDDADVRVIAETGAATAAWMTLCSALSDPLMTFRGPKITDADRDGMNDSWELARGLNPADSSDARSKIGEYDAIEVYVNELSDTLVARASVASESPVLFAPASPALRMAPNPFTGRVAFLIRSESVARSELSIFGASGQRVFVRALELPAGGSAEIGWDGAGSDGRALPTGSYLVSLRQGGKRFTGRLILLR